MMLVQNFKKKPVVIQAVLLTTTNGEEVAAWCLGNFDKENWELRIPTLEGVMTADVGDWIIRGVKGEFYPCKPDIFDATYEEVR